MSDKNIVYIKTENGIFKCYKSEQMHKPIYHPVESKMNGYIDYNEVEKILTIEDLYQENKQLKEVINKARLYVDEHSTFAYRRAERNPFNGELKYVDACKVFFGNPTKLLDILKVVE